MLTITHNAGFFSCCNIRLLTIIDYFNKNKCLPNNVNSSSQFIRYKKYVDRNNDITHDFFEDNKEMKINFDKQIKPTNENKEDQFSNYKLLNIGDIYPFIKKYFNPSKEILIIKKMLMEKYNIVVNNCIAVYYRGTDKCRETTLCDYNKFYDKIESLKLNNYQILIQTDTLDFLNYMKTQYPNSIVFSENKVSHLNLGIHNENNSDENYNDIKYLFATFLLMSECNHLVMSSSNCSLWMTYYRSHINNIYQCVDNDFIK